MIWLGKVDFPQGCSLFCLPDHYFSAQVTISEPSKIVIFPRKMMIWLGTIDFPQGCSLFCLPDHYFSAQITMSKPNKIVIFPRKMMIWFGTIDFPRDAHYFLFQITIFQPRSLCLSQAKQRFSVKNDDLAGKVDFPQGCSLFCLPDHSLRSLCLSQGKQ